MEIEKASFGQRVANTTKKIIRIILFFLLLAGVGTFSFFYWGVYDEGIRAGKVLRISKQGVLFKTYEGQLSMDAFGSLRGTSPIAETFDFSVEKNREAVIKDLESVAQSGERVNLRYVKRYAAFPWRGATKYYVVQVERGANPN